MPPKTKEKASFTKSAQELDLEQRYAAEKGEESEGRDFAVEGNDLSGYRGVSPEYATYSNDTDKPLASEKGAFKKLEDRVDKVQSASKDASDNKADDDNDDDNDEDEDKKGPPPPPAPPA